MNRGKGLTRTRMKVKGRKSLEWERVRAELKLRFEAMGITTCELRWANCAFDDFLSFAHAKKRRKLKQGELYIVILACQFCHDELEVMPHEKMESIVMRTIQAREVRLAA